MPSKNAKTPKTVLFVVFPQVKLLDIAGPLQVFSDANDEIENCYEVVVASSGGGDTPTDTVLPVATRALEDCRALVIDTLIISGGEGAYAASQNPDLLDCIRYLAARSRRVGSVCTGAYVLSATGLLEGRRVVTHWNDCAQLQSDFPHICVEMDPIYINDGCFWSSAGVTAGIDMALAMVAEDCGKHVSLALARSLVAYMVRPGGQSQFSAVLTNQSKDTMGQFDELHTWIENNLASRISVEKLATIAKMSARNFSRVYKRKTGQSPAKAVETMRVDAARRLLEGSGLPVKTIALKTGFGDEERMRRALHRSLHVSPNEYRERFNSSN
ncbi:GlxA family transcriptional regulator [Phaeobacter piscinae]|uniref:GlxA family transcriptional regulator n=1 Tax=Phaeobacter piscinae TaxID=1580596 RepID=UPI00059143A3|nr:helix-turn-helix domain-containing protein [Phaeobacter piscinae]UTS82867.1 HTH-type transcriptional activator RhaS [Phaeobacter piscinae]